MQTQSSGVAGHSKSIARSRNHPQPLLNQKIFAPYKIATLIETIAGRGIPADVVLAGTGLIHASVEDPHTLTSVAQYIAACENIIDAGADLDVAFAIGSHLHLSAYGMYGYALMCSPTMRDFFDFAVRYHLLATPTLQLGWREERGRAIWELKEIHGAIMSRDLRNFLLRQQMMQTYTHMRDVAGITIVPLEARFAFDDAGTGIVDERMLECPCRYGAPAHELHYSADILDQAPKLGNRLTRALLEETCDRLIGQAKTTTGTAGEVYQYLMLAPNHCASMQIVADRMGMTDRTLRRRLAEERTSYAQITDDVRKTLALEYLRTTRMTADDIAWKVGFSDSANLRRAIKRWTGRTIGDIRRH